MNKSDRDRQRAEETLRNDNDLSRRLGARIDVMPTL